RGRFEGQQFRARFPTREVVDGGDDATRKVLRNDDVADRLLAQRNEERLAYRLVALRQGRQRFPLETRRYCGGRQRMEDFGLVARRLRGCLGIGVRWRGRSRRLGARLRRWRLRGRVTLRPAFEKIQAG